MRNSGDVYLREGQGPDSQPPAPGKRGNKLGITDVTVVYSLSIL